LRSFVNEARLLARFDHPSLVKVYRFWEANGTAYMAMHMVHGRTLRQVRQQLAPGSPGEAWCRALLEPLLGALEALHGEGVYHRDIAPDNIVLAESGKPVLLDFGAARRVIGDHTHALTAILKPHFAPIEQYAEVASMRQGPWTDLYGLAATFYYLLTGQPPLPAAARALHDELPPLARLQPAGCSAGFLQALDWAMAVRPQQRPQSVAVWRDVLEGRMPVPASARQDVTTPGATALARTGLPDFDPTLPLPTQPRPPGSTPGAGAIWRGFTVPGGVPTLLPAAPAAAPAEGKEDAASAVPGRSAVRGLRRSVAWAGGMAGMLVLAAAAVLGWKPPRAASASVPDVPAAAVPEVQAVPARAPSPTESPPMPVAQQASSAALPPPTRPAVEPAAPPVQQAGRVPAPPAPRERPRGREREHVDRAAVAAPSERCAGRMFLTRLICMQRACDADPRLRHHPECVQMQKAEQERRERMLQR
jgi:hypothetical protein